MSIVNRVRSEVDNVMTTVETRMWEAVLTAIEDSAFRLIELAMKTVIAFSGGNIDCAVPYFGPTDFSGDIESPQLTVSGGIISNTD